MSQIVLNGKAYLSAMHHYQLVRRSLKSIIEDVRCTPEQRLEAIAQLDAIRIQDAEKRKEKAGKRKKKRKPRTWTKAAKTQETDTLSRLVQKAEMTQ